MKNTQYNPLYLITGVMAAGKSTVAELLIQRFSKGVHLRGDVFRKMIVTGREEMTAHPTAEALRQLNLRYDLAAGVADTYQAAGFTVVWQDVMIGRVLPEVIARIRSVPLFLIVLCPDPAIITQREANRPKKGYGGGFTPDNFHRLLLTETPRTGLWIDSSQQTPAETVEEILIRTGNGEGLIGNRDFFGGQKG